MIFVATQSCYVDNIVVPLLVSKVSFLDILNKADITTNGLMIFIKDKKSN